jgi:hypothetical protein
MNTILSSKRNHYLAKVGIVLTMVALIVGMAGCGCNPSSRNIEIGDWHDLDAIRNKLDGNYILTNNLDSTTAGYEELASPTANQGKGWQPIGTRDSTFYGSFDGQGYEVRDLFINRPAERDVGLFGAVYNETVIKNLGVVNADVTGQSYVGSLVGINYGTVSSSYSNGNVIGEEYIGGLVGGSATTVSNSYSAASVTGNTLVGGLLGGNTGTVSNSYSTGSAIGDSQVGGLVGGNGGTASNSYSTGSVTGSEDVGGLVGKNYEGTVSNSFWDIKTSGQTSSDGGTGKTTAEMKDIDTFSGAGWNIIAVASGWTNDGYIWNIINDETYPFLSYQ